MLCSRPCSRGPGGSSARSTGGTSTSGTGRIFAKRRAVTVSVDIRRVCRGCARATRGSVSVDEPGAAGERARLGAAAGTELGHHVGDVHAHGLGGDEQLLADLAVASAGRDQSEDLPLAGSQGTRIGGTGTERRAEQLEQRLGAKAGGDRAGGAGLLLAAFTVTGSAQDEGEVGTCAGLFVDVPEV